MSQAWSPEIEISKDKAELMIEKQFPQLKPVKATVLGEGFDNSVFLINNEYVFRFPRREIAAELIRTENRILPVISPNLPIATPNPIFHGAPEDDYPWEFGGYKSLEGMTPTKLTAEQRLKSAKPLAEFLKALHEFPLEEAKKLQVPYDKLDRINIEKRKPMFQTRVEEAFAKNLIQDDIFQGLQEFLTTISGSLTDQTQTLVHGDLHIRNMLVDELGEVSAIIDWGDTHIGHPAIDLSIAYSFLPPEGREIFFALYGDVSSEVKNIARFKAIYTIILLLLYAHDQKDELLKEDCLETLNLALKD